MNMRSYGIADYEVGGRRPFIEPIYPMLKYNLIFLVAMQTMDISPFIFKKVPDLYLKEAIIEFFRDEKRYVVVKIVDKWVNRDLSVLTYRDREQLRSKILDLLNIFHMKRVSFHKRKANKIKKVLEKEGVTDSYGPLRDREILASIIGDAAHYTKVKLSRRWGCGEWSFIVGGGFWSPGLLRRSEAVLMNTEEVKHCRFLKNNFFNLDF